MGNETFGANSKSNSNSTKSDSKFSNSANDDSNFETMNCLSENKNTIIQRVWIVKRSINLSDQHISTPMSRVFGESTKLSITFLKKKKCI